MCIARRLISVLMLGRLRLMRMCTRLLVRSLMSRVTCDNDDLHYYYFAVVRFGGCSWFG